MRLTTSISGSRAPPGPPVRGMPRASAAALMVLATSGVTTVALAWPVCAPAHWKASVASPALVSTFNHFAFADMPPLLKSENLRAWPCPAEDRLVMFSGDSMCQIPFAAGQRFGQHGLRVTIQDLYARSCCPRLQQHIRIVNGRRPS